MGRRGQIGRKAGNEAEGGGSVGRNNHHNHHHHGYTVSTLMWHVEHAGGPGKTLGQLERLAARAADMRRLEPNDMERWLTNIPTSLLADSGCCHSRRTYGAAFVATAALTGATGVVRCWCLCVGLASVRACSARFSVPCGVAPVCP